MAGRKTAPGQADGSECHIGLLRSLDWIEKHGAHVGGAIFLDLPEIGVEGEADVLAIGPCPPLEEGEDRLVTGTFRHTLTEVYALKLASESRSIGVTAMHLFWSVDRNDWVSAIDLDVGETLKTLTGTTVVESMSKRPQPDDVYNIEVEGDHVYRVGESGVLVHNASNRGRMQAQGGCLEESEPWDQDCPPTESEGHGMADNLEAKIGANEAKSRESGFRKLHRFISNAASTGGADAPVSISWKTPQTKDVRVDLEIKTGKAFVPDP